MFRGSIYAKFLCIQVPAFLLALGLGLHVLAQYRVHRAQEEFGVRIGSQAARIAGLLADVDFIDDTENANRLLSLFLADRAVLCVELINKGRVSTEIASPRRVGCAGSKTDQFLTVPLPGEQGQELKIGLTLAEIDQIRTQSRDFVIALVMAAGSLAALIAFFAFRHVVGRPVRRLLRGIQQSAITGQQVTIAKHGPDELGVVIDAFNLMQDRIATESSRVIATRDNITRLYNSTPALLFTMNAAGTLLSVSDFWLEATGYTRDEVTDKNFAQFIPAGSRARLINKLLEALARDGKVRDEPLQLCCKNGVELETMFSAVASGTEAEGGSRFVCIISDVTRLRTVETRLREMAHTDSLTGLPNRSSLMEALKALVSTEWDVPPRGAVMLIDLDNFKWINDTHGHAAGDATLIEVARRLRSCVGPDDLVARLGGDEFAVICRDLVTDAQAEAIAAEIVSTITPAIDLGGAVGFVGASIGIAHVNRAGLDVAELLRQADLAMYAAKRAGKSQHAVFSDEQAALGVSETIQRHLIEQGLNNHWFELYFQPIIDLATMKVAGAEVLLRLKLPTGENVPIEKIIRVAEQTGQIDRLGTWVLQEAARHFVALSTSSGRTDFYLSINLSARQLHRAFLKELRRVLADVPALVGHLVLEITETAAIRRFDLVTEILGEIRNVGARIAIDDFGTGYSSMSYISRLPIDIIKLDRSYISAFEAGENADEESRKRQALVRATATLGQELGVPLVAEGIENNEVAAIIRGLGIAFGQGYLFAYPMPAPAVSDWLKTFADRPTSVADAA